MGKMIVFEVISETKEEVFVTGYNLKEERLFPYKKIMHWLLADKTLRMDTTTTVRRWTAEGSFVMQKLCPGDYLVIKKNGDWKIRRSLKGYSNQFYHRLKEAFFELKTRRTEDLGTIEREVAQTCSYIDVYRDIIIS